MIRPLRKPVDERLADAGPGPLAGRGAGLRAVQLYPDEACLAVVTDRPRGYRAVQPPSTISETPVTYRDASDAR